MTKGLASFDEIVVRFNRAIRRRDWPTMRSTLHDDVVVVSVSAQATLGADELVDWVTKASQSSVYDIEPWTVESIDERSVLAVGHARFTTAPGRMSDNAFVWLLTGLENRIWRLRPFTDRTQALEHLRVNGHALGLQPPPAGEEAAQALS